MSRESMLCRVILKSQDAPIDVWLVSRANEGEAAGGASPSPLTAAAASPLPNDSFRLPTTPAGMMICQHAKMPLPLYALSSCLPVEPSR